jgi:hypothetical protein
LNEQRRVKNYCVWQQTQTERTLNAKCHAVCVLSYWKRRKINHRVMSIKIGADVTKTYAETVLHCRLFTYTSTTLDLLFIRSSFFWDVTQYRLVVSCDVSGPIFKGQVVQEYP